jgi:hypothetical protein
MNNCETETDYWSGFRKLVRSEFIHCPYAFHNGQIATCFQVYLDLIFRTIIIMH